ncbi:hypothetical protein BJF82_13130 [Kytococcus sp. CUA-901]|nr:hypothetical protein BJF82_13130 [Kytococcus sp. CUA-901]
MNSTTGTSADTSALAPPPEKAEVTPSGLHRNLRVWEVTALSVGFMGPVMAMSLNGIGVAGLVGKAVPFTFAISFAGVMLVAYAFIRLTRYFTHAGSVYALAGATLGPRAASSAASRSWGPTSSSPPASPAPARCSSRRCSASSASRCPPGPGSSSPSWPRRPHCC